MDRRSGSSIRTAQRKAVGVSSGSGEEDLEVARAGVAVIPGASTDW